MLTCTHSMQREHAPDPVRLCGCRYNLSGFAMKLNELTPGLKERLAPTDCRLRPDQRATELGQYDEVWAYGLCLAC